MTTSDVSSPPPSKRPGIPRWLGPVYWAIGFPLAHMVVPWGLSRLTPRYGWAAAQPGAWNWLGLVWVGLGSAIVVWAMVVHFRQAPEGWEWEPTPRYLVRRGPYRFTRNPMYLAELALWLGWALFYGNLAVLIGFLMLGAAFDWRVVPREERDLEARFGEAYRQYQRSVPRWLGPTQRQD